MPPTEQICRYVGRQGSTSAGSRTTVDASTFDDTVSVPALSEALSGATVLLIDDPLSFPWDAFDSYFMQLLIINASHCDEDALTALRPVLSKVTLADTILDPPLPLPALSTEFETRSTAPDPSHYRSLFDDKQLHHQDRSIKDRVLREVGDHVNLQRISIDDVVSSGQPLDDYLNALGAETGSSLRGLWGVQSAPGMRLQYGWAAFEPREERNE